MERINYIGLDVHKKNIVMAESIEAGQAEVVGEYPNTDKGLKKMIKQLKQRESEYSEVKICYEAGPCGYAVKREIDKAGFNCEIVAPSLIPVQGGNRVKTDQRDAKKLARYYRAGELTMVYVPTEEQEGIRDLIRCRDDLVGDIKRYKQRINHFLIRQGLIYQGKSHWTGVHRQWIRGLILKHEQLNSILMNYLSSLELLELQLEGINQEIQSIAKKPEYIEKVNALCAYRGIGVLTAMIIISEIVDFRRFRNARELMSYLGLTPSEYSSGGTEKKGSITKCGNSRVRRALIESGWHYIKKPTVTMKMKQDLEKVPQDQRVNPVKSMKRLNQRFYYLMFKGKSRQKAVVAIARELSGFIWDTLINLENRAILKKAA